MSPKTAAEVRRRHQARPPPLPPRRDGQNIARQLGIVFITPPFQSRKTPNAATPLVDAAAAIW